MTFVGGVFSYREAGPNEDGDWCDWWFCEDLRYPMTRVMAAAGYPRDEVTVSPITMDDMRRGCSHQKERLEDMDANWTEASLCFPTFPRFCGQTFLERSDSELGDLCVKAYNDWMFDEWCAGTDGRLIPLPIVQLWDAELAAAEVRRNAARGGHAVAFTEIPPFLGLPVGPRRRRLLGSVLPRVRGDRDGRVHAHRLVVEDAVDVGRRAARGGLDAHVHERGDVAHRLPHVGRARALPDARARVLGGPDRLDPVRARPRRQGVAREPRLGWRRRQGDAAAERVVLPRRVRLLLRRPARAAQHRGRRCRQRHVRDRLPAQRLDLARDQGGRRVAR